MRRWLELLTDRRSVTALEYALIASLILVVVIAAMSNLGTNLGALFGTISSEM
jgi:pilus assembly protein Flp/PilA